MGFTHISEDSSEIVFLLVENYNHDHSRVFYKAWESLEHNLLNENSFFHYRRLPVGCCEEEVACIPS